MVSDKVVKEDENWDDGDDDDYDEELRNIWWNKGGRIGLQTQNTPNRKAHTSHEVLCLPHPQVDIDYIYKH